MILFYIIGFIAALAITFFCIWAILKEDEPNSPTYHFPLLRLVWLAPIAAVWVIYFGVMYWKA